jgi:pyrimidine-nucleoside phosphorylase
LPPRRSASPRAVPLAVPSLIARKRDGGGLTPDEIAQFLDGAVAGRIPEYQVAAMLMAIVFRGLADDELVAWTRTMIASGDRLDLSGIDGPKIDKHSTGGVGDKISLCLAPLVAACGVNAPMLVGRALGHTGGTLDKLESIRGFRVGLSAGEFRKVLRATGFVVAGQTPRIVPADRLLYALRDATATVESIPLIASSILSKKIAGGADALVMDVKAGRGAFLPSLAQTRALARTLVSLGARLGLPTVALLTAMDEPLGDEIGNALEVKEAIDVLRGAGPPDTRALTVRLGAEMLVLGKAARDVADGSRRIEAAIGSGAGLERFVRAVGLQGGDVRQVEAPARLPRARKSLVVTAPRAGHLDTLDARLLGQAATLLGAGRLRKEDAVDPGVGLTLHAKTGTKVSRGEPLVTVWYNDSGRLAAARPLVASAVRVVARAPRPRPLVLERIA